MSQKNLLLMLSCTIIFVTIDSIGGGVGSWHFRPRPKGRVRKFYSDC